MEDCMPTSPTTVGREFVRRYYIIMNQSPENLHCFFSEDASFVHDDIDSTERQTITADGKMGIRDVMLARTRKYKHTATKVTTVDTVETLHDGLIIQVNGEISYNEQPLRPFSQTIILVRTSPFQFYVQNDIFRFCDMDFDVDNIGSDTVSDQTKPPAEDWGTQCEEYIEPSEAQSNSTQTEPRAGISRNDTDRDAQRNEVKLDTSDSGLSSDAEKAIMDMQSLNLKSILQEPRTNTKNAAMKSAPAPPETEPPTEAEVQTGDDGNRSQLFRDSCILTVGKVINPTIEFGYAKCDENTTSDNEKTQDSVDTLNTIGNDENNTGKIRYRKRKDKRRAKNEKGVFFDESNKEKEANQPSTDNRSDHSTVSADESPLTESKVEEPTDNPTEPESLKEMERETKEETSKPTEQEPPKDTEFEQGTPKEVEQETPKTAVQRKTYADLAKAGSSEWVDELASRRDFNIVAEKSKSRPPLPRRSSRSEKTTPPNGKNGYFTRKLLLK